jgi:hypothetical protein
MLYSQKAMELELSRERQQTHALVDRLPGEQLVAIRSLLETIVSPVDRSLATALIDDEPVTAEDAEALREARTSLDRGEGISHEDILREFGLTPQ